MKTLQAGLYARFVHPRSSFSLHIDEDRYTMVSVTEGKHEQT
jgi:hypothetical protein